MHGMHGVSERAPKGSHSMAWRTVQCIPQAVLLTVLANALPSHAYPQLYVGRVSRTDCSAHPVQAYGRHQEPVVDSSTSITFTASDAQAVTASSPNTRLCAGSSYIINIDLGGQQRSALVTASSGSLKASDDSDNWVDGIAQAVADWSEDIGLLQVYSEQCPGRYITPVLSSSLGLTLSLPEDATGDLELKVTSAASASDSFKTATVTTPILTRQQCEAPEEMSPSPSPVVSPQPATQSPLPSRSPSPAVLQPDLSPAIRNEPQPTTLPTEVSTSPLESPASTAVDVFPASSSSSSVSTTAALLPGQGAQGVAMRPQGNLPATATRTGQVPPGSASSSSQAAFNSQLLGQIAAANVKGNGTHTAMAQPEGHPATSGAAGWRRLLLRGATAYTMAAFVAFVLLAP